MASASIPRNRNTNEDTRSARIAIVEQHIRLENQHDLEGVLRPSAILRATTMRRGANTIRARTGSAYFTSR